jgi:hypothetical protein
MKHRMLCESAQGSSGKARTIAGGANFNVQNPIINPEQVLTDETAYLVQTIGYAIVYIALLLVASMLIFNQREM